jgi:hypothetical protein
MSGFLLVYTVGMNDILSKLQIKNQWAAGVVCFALSILHSLYQAHVDQNWGLVDIGNGPKLLETLDLYWWSSIQMGVVCWLTLHAPAQDEPAPKPIPDHLL